jgi:hypothetical protein
MEGENSREEIRCYTAAFGNGRRKGYLAKKCRQNAMVDRQLIPASRSWKYRKEHIPADIS